MTVHASLFPVYDCTCFSFSYKSLIQQHDLPAIPTFPALRCMAVPSLGYMAGSVRLRHRQNGYMALRLRQRFPALRLFAACLPELVFCLLAAPFPSLLAASCIRLTA